MWEALSDLITNIIDYSDLHEKYGTKGCLLMVLFAVIVFLAILGFALWYGARFAG